MAQPTTLIQSATNTAQEQDDGQEAKYSSESIKAESLDVDFSVFSAKDKCSTNHEGHTSILVHCACVKRVVEVLCLHSELKHRHAMSEAAQSFLFAFASERYRHLVDDMTHLTVQHDGDLEAILDEAMKRAQLSRCSLDACAMSDRHSAVDAAPKTALEPQLQFLVNLLCDMHFYVLHAFDAGLRVKLSAQRTENEADACAATGFVDAAFARMKHEIHAKRAKLHRFRGRLQAAHKKFALSTVGREAKGTFFDFLRKHLAENEGVAEHMTDSLFAFLVAQHFDTEATFLDLQLATGASEMAQSNILNFLNLQRAQDVHVAALLGAVCREWKCMFAFWH